MIHFPFLKQFGITALMSDQDDGDCSTRSGGEAFLNSNPLTLHHPLHLLNQVHSATLVEALPENDGANADGLYTSQTDRVLGIRIADCVPLFLFDPHTRAGALVHAGRAGTFSQIAIQAIHALRQTYTCAPAHIHALIGPSAGPCCYEVSEEIAQKFAKSGGVTHNRHLDLWKTNQAQLLQQGLLPEHIHSTQTCTICSDQFHSYRKNAPTARNIALLHIHKES